MKCINQQFWSVWWVIFNHKQRRKYRCIVNKGNWTPYSVLCTDVYKETVWPRLVDGTYKTTLVCAGFKWARHVRMARSQTSLRAVSLLSSRTPCMVSTQITSYDGAWVCKSRFLALVGLLFFVIKAETNLKNSITKPPGLSHLDLFCSWFLPLCLRWSGSGRAISLFWYVGGDSGLVQKVDEENDFIYFLLK